MRRRAVWFASLLVVLVLAVAAARSANEETAVREAAAAMQRGEFAAAEATLRAELRVRPNGALALSLLGLALDNQKKFREAADAHGRARANAPNSADVWSNYGRHLELTGDDKGALAAYVKALSIDPNHHNANLQAARLALKQKDGTGALGFLKK